MRIQLPFLQQKDHTHTRTHARTHARTHTRTYAHTHARTHAYTHPPTHTHTHKHARTRTHARTHVHTHTHTHCLLNEKLVFLVSSFILFLPGNMVFANVPFFLNTVPNHILWSAAAQWYNAGPAIKSARVRIPLCYRFEDWAFSFSTLTPLFTQLYK